MKYKVTDNNETLNGLTYGNAAALIADWYRDQAEWATGSATDDENLRVRNAIASVPEPSDDGTIEDLQDYAESICRAVAEANGAKVFAGHGTYEVSAADEAGLNLRVEAEEA
jgi:hypothetical protein